jgi:hypothetical protein
MDEKSWQTPLKGGKERTRVHGNKPKKICKIIVTLL